MKKIASFLLAMFTSVFAYAAEIELNFNFGGTSGAANFTPLQKIIVATSNIIGSLVPVMIALAVVVFFWFLVQFIWKGAEDPKVHQNGMKGMGYSLLAIFVMVSLWGIIGFVGNALGIGQGGKLPEFYLPGFK
jgi:fumarate reductase subunit D